LALLRLWTPTDDSTLARSIPRRNIVDRTNPRSRSHVQKDTLLQVCNKSRYDYDDTNDDGGCTPPFTELQRLQTCTWECSDISHYWYRSTIPYTLTCPLSHLPATARFQRRLDLRCHAYLPGLEPRCSVRVVVSRCEEAPLRHGATGRRVTSGELKHF